VLGAGLAFLAVLLYFTAGIQFNLARDKVVKRLLKTVALRQVRKKRRRKEVFFFFLLEREGERERQKNKKLSFSSQPPFSLSRSSPSPRRCPSCASVSNPCARRCARPSTPRGHG